MKNMKKLLVTAFMPFGGDVINPTELVLNKLPDELNGVMINKLLLPVEYIKAKELIKNEYDKITPDAVIMLGQAGRREEISIERIAKNLMDAKIADNSGYLATSELIKDGGDNIFSTLPVEEINEAINKGNIKSNISDDAGSFVCNYVFYNMLDYNKGRVPTGFIHVPFILEQGHSEYPSMALNDIYKGIIKAIEVVIEKIKNGQ